MDITHQSLCTTPSVSALIPDDLVNSFSSQQIALIENSCEEIDSELHKLKFVMVNIGKALHRIHTAIKTAAPHGQAIPLFEQLVEHRFGKKRSWAYQMITIYETFNDSDPILEHCSASVVRHLTQLEPQDLDVIRGSLVAGSKLSEIQAKSLVKFINSQRDRNMTLEELQEQISQVTAKNQALEKTLDAKEIAANRLQKELDNSEASQEKLAAAFRDKQEQEANIIQELHDARQKLKDNELKAEAERKLAKIKMQTVEVEVPPAGYTTIEDAIIAIEETHEKRSAELALLDKQIEERSAVLLGEDSVNQKLVDLHKKSADMARLHLEIVTTTRASDLAKFREVLENIAQTCNKVSVDLLRQFA